MEPCQSRASFIWSGEYDILVEITRKRTEANMPILEIEIIAFDSDLHLPANLTQTLAPFLLRKQHSIYLLSANIWYSKHTL